MGKQDRTTKPEMVSFRMPIIDLDHIVLKKPFNRLYEYCTHEKEKVKEIYQLIL